jgi:hypothetical protein
MGKMNRWDLVLLVVSGYVATVALVRLMTRRRNELLDEFRRKVKMEKKRKEREEERSGNRGPLRRPGRAA